MRFLLALFLSFFLLIGVSCGEDVNVVHVDEETVVQVNADFTLTANSTVGSLSTELPYLTGTEAASMDERLVSASLTLGTNSYDINGLYTPGYGLFVAQTTVGDTNTYDINCTVTNGAYSGVIYRTVTGSDPIELLDSSEFSGSVSNITRALR